MEDIYRQRGDLQELTGTCWVRQVVNFFWTFFEISWRSRNDKKFENDNGEREKEQI